MKKLVLVLVLLCGCSWFSKNTTAEGKKIFDCAEQSLMTKARNLLPTVVGLLTGGTENWKEQAKVLGKEFGRDALACATRVAIEKIESPVQSEPQLDPEQVKKDSVARARALMIEEGWVYKE